MQRRPMRLQGTLLASARNLKSSARCAPPAASSCAANTIGLPRACRRQHHHAQRSKRQNPAATTSIHNIHQGVLGSVERQF